MNQLWLFLAFALLLGRDLAAQERRTVWWIPAALGYGTIGAEVGYSLAWISYQQDWFGNVVGGPAAGAYLSALVLRAGDHILRDNMRVGILPIPRGAIIQVELSIE